VLGCNIAVLAAGVVVRDDCVGQCDDAGAAIADAVRRIFVDRVVEKSRRSFDSDPLLIAVGDRRVCDCSGCTMLNGETVRRRARKGRVADGDISEIFDLRVGSLTATGDDEIADRHGNALRYVEKFVFVDARRINIVTFDLGRSRFDSKRSGGARESLGAMRVGENQRFRRLVDAGLDFDRVAFSVSVGRLDVVFKFLRVAGLKYGRVGKTGP
jgi:hypothetical protein